MDKPQPSASSKSAKAAKASAKPAGRPLHFPYKDREYFSENLALLLKSAVPVGEALQSIATASPNKKLQKVLTEMQADIDAGQSLANALEHSGLMSDQTLALVSLGEESGHLVENLQLAAQQEEKSHLFAAKVRSALIYPVFVLGLTFVVGLGVAWFLLPRLAQTFSQLHVKLPFITRVMIGLGNFLRQHGKIAVPLVLIAIFSVVYILFFAKKTKHIGQRFLFALPGIGRLMNEVEVAQFGYLLGTLLNAGLPIIKTLELLAGATRSSRHQALYRYLAQSLADGFSLKESLAKYKNSGKLIPAPVQQMIIAGERSGSLPDVLLVIGHTYEQKSDITTANLESIIEPILLVIVAAGVLLVAIAVIIPIYGLVGGLQQ